MHRLTVSFLAVSLALWLAGCGGGGSLGGGTTPSSTITSVLASCSPTSVVEQGTATCTAAVSGTGNYSAAVSWTASAGTINATTGAYTAPASAATVTITATSTEDTTKSGTTTITVTAPVVAVTISPTSVSVPSAGTEQFTATVTGTQTTGVTWSTTAGTISTSGLLSLVGVASGTNVTVTATSVADTTKSASAQVSVTQRVITLSWGPRTDPNGDLSPEFIPDPAGGIVFPPPAYFTGAEAGDIMTISDFSESISLTFNAQTIVNGEESVGVGFCPSCLPGSTGLVTAYDPHFIKVQVASADGTIQSNELWLPLITDQPTIAVSPDGTTAYFTPGVPFPVEKYSLANGTNEGTLFGGGNESIAVDNKTGDVIATQYIPTISTGNPNDDEMQLQNSASNNVLNNGYLLVGITAIGGYGYVTQPNLGQIDKIDLSQMAIVASLSDTAGAGNYPYTMDAATVNSADTIAVYSEEDTTIRLFDSNLNAITDLPLTGITKATAYPLADNDSGGSWSLKLFSSGTVAFLSGYDKSLVTATLDSTLTLHLAHQITLTGNPIGIAKDETHQAVIVWYADILTGMTTMQSFDLATLTGTKIASADTLPVGFLASDVVVSSDGTKLYVGGINPANGQPAFYILQNK